MLYKNELFFHIFELRKESFFALCNLFFSLVVSKPLGGPSLLGDLLCCFLGSGRVFSDCSMCFGIHTFDAFSSNSILDEGSKLSLVCIFIFFNKMPHIISDVFTEDMITVNGGIEFGSFLVVSREPLGGMRDIQTFYRLISKLFLTQSFETAQYDFMQTTQDTLPPSTAP